MLFVLLMFVKVIIFVGRPAPRKFFNIATSMQAHTASTHNCITIAAEADIIVFHLPPAHVSVYCVYYSLF